MTDFFSREEIESVEEAFGYSYLNDTERLAVIQCNETKDIVACPGSGKTSCLAAKLFLLYDRLPFENNRGICVLAHTNNTINVIKKKLGKKAELYSTYPNYLGTIQGFVDKFLAIPYFRNKYHSRVQRIDSDSYNNAVLSYDFPRPVRTWIERQYNYEEMLCKIRFDKYMNLIPELNKDSSKFKLKNKNSATYKSLVSMKDSILKSGILHYDDAYYLANRYIKEYPNILDSLKQRFLYVFIDEMQDTAKHQLEIIEKCFNGTVIIQRFGDPNQSIYSSTGSLRASIEWQVKASRLDITTSKRFAPNIAKIVNKLSVRPFSEKITGDPRLVNNKVTLLTLKNEERRDVLKAFSRIIIEKKLNNNMYPFKAIGWVGKDKNNGKLCIPRYCKFIQQRSMKKKDFPCLNGYVNACELAVSRNEGNKEYVNIVFRCLAKVLRECEVLIKGEYLSAEKLEEYIKIELKNENVDLRTYLTDWYLKITKGESIEDEVKKYINEKFVQIFNLESTNIDSFLSDEHEVDTSVEVENRTLNQYEEDSFEIEISTIHSAKGETHEATLYLETFYKKNDVKKLIEFFANDSIDTTGPEYQERLKMAYVGMSRPRSLLCVAASEDSISGREDKLAQLGWEVRKVSEILRDK